RAGLGRRVGHRHVQHDRACLESHLRRRLDRRSRPTVSLARDRHISQRCIERARALTRGTFVAPCDRMLTILATLASLPWLQGFDTATVADRGEPAASAADDRCVASAYGDLRLTADVAPARGDETIVASFTQGITVYDHAHHAI